MAYDTFAVAILTGIPLDNADHDVELGGRA